MIPVCDPVIPSDATPTCILNIFFLSHPVDNIIALIQNCAEGEDAWLKEAIPSLTEESQQQMYAKLNEKPGGFNTIIHNDLHMNNVMFT